MHTLYNYIHTHVLVHIEIEPSVDFLQLFTLYIIFASVSVHFLFLFTAFVSLFLIY